MHRLLIAITMMLSVCTLNAQVYKCEGPDGSVVFSDKECGGDAEIIENLDVGSSGVGAASGGPPMSLTLGNGSILEFKKILSLEVRTENGYRTGREGLYVHYEGTDRLVEWENLESFYIISWDRDYCGNLSHICEPRVRIRTREREFNTRYRALRSIKVLVDDELDGTEKEMTIYFAVENRPHIRAIRF
jgi:hypothetical protein